MLTGILLFLAGLALVVKGGDWFVSAALRLAGGFRVPRVVLGGTLVSLATTSPELVVSLTAGARGESGLAVGNAIGSCACNLGLILGLSALLRPFEIGAAAPAKPLGILFMFASALFLMTWDLSLSPGEGWLLIAAGLGYFVMDFQRHWREARRTRFSGRAAAEQPRVDGRDCGVFVSGALVMVLGSRLLVEGAVTVAAGLGIPSVIIGLTVVAVGTSLPELITALASTRRAAPDLAVGNILGANIANLSLIVGAAAAWQEVRLSPAAQHFHFSALLAWLLLVGGLALTGSRLTRPRGLILLAGYAVYLLLTLGLTLAGRL